MSAPRTVYAHSGDASIAYQVVGDGPLNLVLANGPCSHIEIVWEEPTTARCLRRLASFSRLVLFDRRGTGLSDPVSRPPTLEQQMDDLRAVLDDAGIERTALYGANDLGLCALLRRHVSRSGQLARALGRRCHRQPDDDARVPRRWSRTRSRTAGATAR